MLNGKPPKKNRKYLADVIKTVLSGITIVLLGIIIWGTVVYLRMEKIVYLSVFLGTFVGIAIRFIVRSNKPLTGLIAGLITAIGCLIGDYITVYIIFMGILEQELSLRTFNIFFSSLTLEQIFKNGFTPVDFAFHIVAIYIGYRLSLNKPFIRKTNYQEE